MKIKSRLRSSLPRAAKATVPAVVGLGLLGFAVPSAGATTTTYAGTAKASGLVINLFGTQLTGGTATASVDSSAAGLLASAEGVGTLTPGMIEDSKANVTSAGKSDGDSTQKCDQGGSAPASSPIGITLGLACSSAVANITGDGVPSAAATGEIAGLDVNLSSLLNQIISGGGNQLFSGIQQVLAQLNGSPLGTGNAVCPDPNTPSGSSSSSTSSSNTSSGNSSSQPSTSPVPNPLTALAGTASVPGSPLNTLLGSLGLGTSTAASSPGPLAGLLGGICQTLTNIENVVKLPSPPSTLVVKIGPASASVTGTSPSAAKAEADGATAEVQILPGVGCDAASLAACITSPSQYAVPLIDIKVAPAHASSIWDGSNWTPKTTDSLATVDLNIPGFAQTIDIPAGQSQDLLAGTPLETVIDLGSATTTGTGSNAGSGSGSGGGGNGTETVNGASLDIAKGVNGGILLDLGTTGVSGTAATPTVAVKQQPPIPAVVAAGGSPAATPPAVAPVASPTLVHTGAWWSGSLPYLAGIAALGGGLLGWPRLRRGSKGLGTLLRAARR